MSLDLDAPPVDPQALAADPKLSAFVTANAGSGKTKTLIDRVARLLLAKAKPETILCVTYTKAAAAEMQQRLFKTLGEWCVLGGEELARRLHELDGRRVDPGDREALSEARRLFAKALETPGGLKIQTIHAFCEKLLRRFPLEAGVSPAFRVVDDAAAAALASGSRRGLAEYVLSGEGAIADAYARLSVALDFGSFESMFGEFEAKRGALATFLKREGGLDGAVGWVWRTVEVARGTTAEDVAVAAMAQLNAGAYRRGAAALDAGSKTDIGCAAELTVLADSPVGQFERALSLFFTKGGEGPPATWVERSAKLKADPAAQMLLLAEQARLNEARERMRAANVARDSIDALTLAAAYLTVYEREKTAVGALDFADLIEKACHLLRDRPAAAWVLYKLDGGIDHILLDEAQDTAPDQWTIIKALTGDFFSGAGVGGETRERQVFVVGDQKQSIYSFQGAQPHLLLKEHASYERLAAGVGVELPHVKLLTSWRSTPEVLAFVDAVFAPPELAAAIQPGVDQSVVEHRVAPPRADHAGCVDVWDLAIEMPGTERDAWNQPLDTVREDSANRRLAQRIAAEIRDLIDRGEAVWDKDKGRWRPAHAGDVLILVRRRKALFEEILRALKQAELPVAGADRLALSGHIIFDDLLALARFSLFPTDELTLAALLKSPFCGLDDEALYALAHARERENLWRRLERRAEERADWRAAHAFLSGVLEAGRSRRPFEFYVHALGVTDEDGRSMRRRLLERLGGEAEDALDEFLNQVLAAEARGVHGLERLAAELERLDIVVKREMEGQRAEVRVMTAHGAKGLEAPIVFLPETTLTQTQRGSPLLPVARADGEGFLWCASATRDCPPTSAARTERANREEAEAFRLLYVALTRARDRLVLCGRISHRTDPSKLKGWWGAVRDALVAEGLDGQVREVETAHGAVRRYGKNPNVAAPEAKTPAPVSDLPAWSRLSPPAEAFARYASPSDLGEDAHTAAASPLATRGGLGRFRRGDLIHRLLQLLPDIPLDQRAAAAVALLAREADLTEPQRAEMGDAALSVLNDPLFAEVFGLGSRAEVAIAGTGAGLPPGLKISGRIDRLVVLPDRVLVADFKTNRPSPDRIEDADPPYLRQMALYAGVLADVFPGRRIEAAIVWTDGPKLMPVPENLIARTLADLRRGG